ncbi:MAG TPA: carboxypeptidase-like regulatory domain-containing protein [Bryobacteraceae bacterium]|nr:carboxypeptidase-like regulatory domain-containing protein [Bryobacteraceae bacterium]
MTMDINEIAKILATPLTESQTLKNAAFSHAADRQSAVVEGLQLEQRRAAALHGNNSAQTLRIQALLAARQQSLSSLQTAAATASARAPLANPQEFIIYGHVYNEAGAPAADVNVSAVDEKGAVLQTTESDAKGSWVLHIGPSVKTGYPAGGTTTDAPTQGSGKKATSQPPPVATFNVEAQDKKKTYRVVAPATFTFQAGKLAYLDLIVPA